MMLYQAANAIALSSFQVVFKFLSNSFQVAFKLQVGGHLGTSAHNWVGNVEHAFSYEGGHFGARAHIQTCWL